MPFTDVIDNYANGATGTLTDGNGDSVGYTVTGSVSTVNWNPSGGPALDNGARVNANGTDVFTVTFDDPVIGAAMQISGSDASEIYYIEVDGVVVDLNTLIANGDVTFTQSGAATHQIGADGSIFGGSYTDGSIAELVFNIPVTSLGAYGTGGSSGNWDYFEVGIDNTTFDVVCFARGTVIKTRAGDVAIEELCPGDLVQTVDNGLQPLRWIGSRSFSAQALTLRPNLTPIRIQAGAMGRGLPDTDLIVSPQHRLMVSSKVAQRMFGISEVFIAANKLTILEGVALDTGDQGVEYFHLLFDDHEVILANALPCESLYLGSEAVKALTPEGRAEVAQIFPHLAEGERAPKLARTNPCGHAQRSLVRRLSQNQKMPVEQVRLSQPAN